jgi:TatD DNase family protein
VAALAAPPRVFPALGLHPWAAGEALDVDALRRALLGSGAVAVGEIGLEYKIEAPGGERQREVLARQLRLARELDLPVILHCRGAFDDLLAILGEEGSGLRGVLHAWSRGPELARRFTDLGLHLGLGGAITRPRARRSRRSARAAPLEQIVLETDAPSIGLEGVEPAATEPAHVARVADALAELRGLPAAEIATRTTENARRLFRLPAGADDS